MFRVGSTTKMFTAALILRLRDRGLLSLDERIDRWFPELTWASTVSVRELLSHRSGIPETLFGNFGILFESGLNQSKIWNAREVADRTMKRLKIAPSDARKFAYSNDNYILLGLIAENVGKKPLSTLFEDEFFSPLGMGDTALLPTPARAALAAGVDSYIPFGPHVIGPKTTCWDSLAFSAGGLASSSADLLKWLDALFGGRVLSASSLEEMRGYLDSSANGRDDRIVAYGLGLARYDLGDLSLLEGHPGAAMGGSCFAFRDAKSGISIVVSYNVSKKNDRAGVELLPKILELCIE